MASSQQAKRQLARRAARDGLFDDATRRRGEIAALGERAEIQLRTRDATIQRTERSAGELLSRLTREYGISMEESLMWCGGAASRAEGLRLRRQYERSATSPEPSCSRRAAPSNGRT